MKKLAVLLIGTLGMIGAASAVPYNHGNHNDPVHEVENNTATIDCGNLSFYSCTSASSIHQFAEQRCDSIIPNIDSGHTVPIYGSSYYHSVSQYGTRIVSVIDQNGGVGPNNYDVNILFSCRGFRHPGKLQKL